MSNILIVFASSHGQTHRIAADLALRLRDRGHTVDVRNVERDPVLAPSGYDAVLLGSRVQFGRHAHALVRYVVHYRAELARVPAGFFSVSMQASNPDAGEDPGDYIATLRRVTGWEPRIYVAFAGALPYRRYGLVLRWVMKQISARAGHPTDTSRDHELTDWREVDRFADDFLEATGLSPDSMHQALPPEPSGSAVARA